MFRTSIATVSLSGDLKDKLIAIGAAGFDGVEIFENDFLAYPAGPSEVGRMVQDAGLKVTVFQPFRDFEGMPEPQRTRAFDRAERKFDVMAALETDLMLICSNVSPASLGGIDRAADDLRELGERAAKRGLRIGFEALAWGRHVFDHRDAWEIVRRADHPAVGLILDSFHTLTRDIDPNSIRRIPGNRIFLVQVADAPRLEMDLLSLSRHFRNMPGQGALDVTGFLAAIVATGYDGHLSLEIFNDQFRAGSARQVAIDGRRSLIAALDAVERREPAPRRSPPKRDLPDRALPLGMEFLEFAVDEESAGELARLFSALGFVRAGRHLSKNVDWWRQGAINLVINSEREGFAHASYITHGPCVCAIGLRMQDAEAAMARARALLAHTFSQPVGPGEMELPAIRGLGGSLIYFTDKVSPLARVWEVEFVPEREGAAGPAPRMRGCSTSTTCRSRWNTRKCCPGRSSTPRSSPWSARRSSTFADPAGLVRSQVVQTATGSVRLALNGSQSNRTMSGRFLSEFFGSGVQHIAFTSNDIFATAERLKANGLTLLSVPENYYDDLEARLGLDPELIDRLRAAGAFYDSDDNGEYFQLYTQPFADRFFFEIVERRRGYSGFGATNAPIRLAAQSRVSRQFAEQRIP